MASSSRVISGDDPTVRPGVHEYAAGGVKFDLTVALLSMWFIVGIFIDGWAHNNGRVDNTFFTPWHGLLYSGVAACGLFLAVTQMRNVTRGYSWLYALPKGYLISLVGAVLFLLGGGFDFFWHSTFGFEADRAALLSPAHLWLASAGLLIITGPIRATSEHVRGGPIRGWVNFFPALLCLTLVLAVLLFFTMFVNPHLTWWTLTATPTTGQNTAFYQDVVAIASAVVSSALTMGVILIAVRRWGKQLPLGSITFILTITNVMAFWLSLGLNILPLPDRVITLLAPIAAGLLGDILLHTLDPQQGGWRLRIFAFAVPFVLMLVFYILLNATEGMGWAIHLSLGTCFYAGITGLFLSYVQVTPGSAPTSAW